MLALKYNPQKQIIVIGGRLKFFDIIEKIKNCFNQHDKLCYTSTFPNRATLRSEAWCSNINFEYGIQKLQKDESIFIQFVHNLGRVMR